MIDDARLRRLIIIGVVLVVGACTISQIMMQMAGGPRDEEFDFSDQITVETTHPIVFEDGLPPFISSGGAFQPEMTVFNIGIGLGGLLMIVLAFETFQRTNPEGRKRNIANVIALVSGTVAGFSLFSLTAHPLTESFVMHIFWALMAFWFVQIWMGSLTYARGEMDTEIFWRGWSINSIRWVLFAVAIISFQLMGALIAMERLIESAFFEWTLAFSAEAMILTLIPSLIVDP